MKPTIISLQLLWPNEVFSVFVLHLRIEQDKFLRIIPANEVVKMEVSVVENLFCVEAAIFAIRKKHKLRKF